MKYSFDCYLNEDEIVDFVKLEPYEGKHALYAMVSDIDGGGYRRRVDIATIDNYGNGCGIGDFNEDGNVDVAVSLDNGKIARFYGDGEGGFVTDLSQLL